MDEERGAGFEQGGEYWKDIPDDILEELYKQLKYVISLKMSALILVFLFDVFCDSRFVLSTNSLL
jgi:hypothetical protein